LLPCGSLASYCANPAFPIPNVIVNAVHYIGSMANNLMYMFGEDIGDAIQSNLKITIAIILPIWLWQIITKFRFPIFKRFLK